jgi:hypothetical protein
MKQTIPNDTKMILSTTFISPTSLITTVYLKLKVDIGVAVMVIQDILAFIIGHAVGQSIAMGFACFHESVPSK